MMCYSSAKSIIVATILIIQIYHSTAYETVNSLENVKETSIEKLRKHTHVSCPALVRSNNWEIEKFFGYWSGIELYSHKTHRNDSYEDTCMRLYIAEVNELNEEMTYGKPIDPFNFRLALRHLKIHIYVNETIQDEHFMTFNNTNQMLWSGNQIRMQVIKFDGKQMMMTICETDKGEIYTILFNRNIGNGKDHQVDSTKLNRLILQGRNLKIQSKFVLRTNCEKIVVENNCVGLEINAVMIFVSFLIYFMKFASC